MSMRLPSFLIAVFLVGPLAAGACESQSGGRTRALVELYTSEGCSSCPPADRWFSALAARADPRVVPVAFHVTYWDELGWRDRFADSRYTARQHDLAAASGASFVYTPQVTIGGGDSRRWSDARAVEQALASIDRERAAAHITLAASPASAQGIAGTASLDVASRGNDVGLFVVLTQDALSSRVTSGENRGEHLLHNAVARDMASAAGRRVEFRFSPRPDWDLSRMSLVAFAQDKRTGRVLQALSMPLCR
jgi:hypothetical protein